MQTVYQDKFQIANLFAEHSFLEFIWQNSKEMKDKDYQDGLKKQVELVEKYKVTKELFDTKDFVFTITVPLQEWTASVIYPQLQRLGIKQFALVVPEEFIAQLALEQAVDEGNGISFNSKFFSLREEARKFLMSIK